MLLNTCCIKFTYNNYVNKYNNIFNIITLWKIIFKTINIHGEIGYLKIYLWTSLNIVLMRTNAY